MQNQRNRLEGIKDTLQFVKDLLAKRAPDDVKKDEENERKIKEKKEQYKNINEKSPDPMKTNTAYAKKYLGKGDAPDMASPDAPKGLDNKRKPVTHDECGRPFRKEEHRDEKEDKKLINDIVDREMDEHNQKMHSGQKAQKSDDYGADKDTKNYLEHFNPATKHPKEPTAGMPAGKKQGERTTPTGFKLKVVKADLVKALAEAGHHESALLLKNWDEMDDNAHAMMKSSYGPKDLNLYDAAANQKRKQTRTGEEIEGAGQNKGVRQYTSAKEGTAKEQASRQAKVDQVKSKSNPVKTYSPEELKAFADARGEKVSKDEGRTLDYKKINPRSKKLSEEEEAKAPTIKYGKGDPEVSNAWKGKDAKSKTDPAVSRKQESKDSRIRTAVKQGKVIDDRPKPGAAPIKPAAAPVTAPIKPAAAPIKPAAAPVKTAQDTFVERKQR